MSSSLLACSGLSNLKKRSLSFPKPKVVRLLQVRAQSLRGEEGKPVNRLDANMTALRERMKRMRMRERLERYWRGREGWSYTCDYDPKVKRDAIFLEYLETAGLALAVLGLTFASGTVTLLLVSLVVHMSQ